MSSSIFATASQLPRGPHGLPREEVADSQRTRLMAAMAELMAAGGYASVTIGALARRAGVSRAAFYEHFADKEACLLAAYDHFAAALIAAMTADLEPDTTWSAFIDSTLAGYIGMLETDPVAARAFVLEMDGAGPAARRRRREAAQLFASLIAHRHAAMRERDPALGPLPERVYLGIALGVRQLIQDALEEDPGPQLSGLAADIRLWIAAVVAGASAAGDA